MSSENLSHLSRDYRYFPGVAGFLASGLLLLFVDKLPNATAQWLIPSLVVYSIGATIVSCVQTMLGVRNRTAEAMKDNLPDKIPPRQFRLIVVAHVLWFFLFVFYIYWRGVI